MNSSQKWDISKFQQEKLIQLLTTELAPLRAKVGVSQGELSKLIGISRQTYSAIECGKRTMTWTTYLSLIFFYDYNNSTHEMIRNIGAFPEESIKHFNNGKNNIYSSINSFTGISESIINKLDSQALHAIRTIIMVEYARCTNLPGDAVIKSFDGKLFSDEISFSDAEAQKSLMSIKERQSNK